MNPTMLFSTWLQANCGGRAIDSNSVVIQVPDYDDAITVAWEDGILNDLMPTLEKGAVEIWAPSPKSSKDLAFQLLSVHIEEAVLSNAAAHPIGVILTADGFRAVLK